LVLQVGPDVGTVRVDQCVGVAVGHAATRKVVGEAELDAADLVELGEIWVATIYNGPPRT
jgi:hypothetical protein